MDIFTADAVSNKINLRCLTNALGQHVIKTVRQKFNGCSCSQIGAANTYHQQDVRIILNLFRCLLNPCKFSLIIIYRQIDPSQKIITGASLLQQGLLCTHDCGLKIGHLFRRNESCCLGIIKHNFLSHNSRSPFLMSMDHVSMILSVLR